MKLAQCKPTMPRYCLITHIPCFLGPSMALACQQGLSLLSLCRSVKVSWCGNSAQKERKTSKTLITEFTGALFFDSQIGPIVVETYLLRCATKQCFNQGLESVDRWNVHFEAISFAKMLRKSVFCAFLSEYSARLKQHRPKYCIQYAQSSSV